jgi:hypothetical protein
MPLERLPGPPQTVTALSDRALTVYEAALTAVPSSEWRAAFLRPPPRLMTSEYTPDQGRLNVHGYRDGAGSTPSRGPSAKPWLDFVDSN